MSEWVLVILFGISNWGNAGVRQVPYATEAECYAALEKVIVRDSANGEGGTIIYCKLVASDE
jgi:hypothetical protein